MERIVYIRGKFRGTNKEMKEAYFYAKEMMTKYDLKPQYIGVMAEEGWTGDKILTIKRKVFLFLLYHSVFLMNYGRVLKVLPLCFSVHLHL